MIEINVTNKRAAVIGTPVVICGNSDYSIKFTFDDEWASAASKIARFVYTRKGKTEHKDVEFTGTTVKVPILSGTREVSVGVYAGDLQTTTPARIPCEYSILCNSGEDATTGAEAPTLLAQINANRAAIEQLQKNGSSGNSGGNQNVAAVDYDLNVKAINHRGYNTVAPENTIPAYILSKKNGFKYVECDVSFTSDGVPVLLHDSTIDRTSDGSGAISSMTYAEASQYDYGSWKSSAYAGTHLPTLEEFLLSCKGLGLHPYIEIKNDSGTTQAMVESIVTAVKMAGMKGKVTYISFNATYLGYVKAVDPAERLGFVVSSINSATITTAQGLKTTTNEVFIDCRYTDATDNAVKLCVDADIPLEVWTANTESSIEELNPYVSGVTSDSLIAGKVLYDKYIQHDVPDAPETPDEPDEPEVTLTSISATYGGGDVAVGTAVTALTGVVVTAHYSDGTSKAVTGYTLSGTIAEGNNTVTVSYGGMTTTFTVTGIAVLEADKDWTGDDTITLYSDDLSYRFACAAGQKGGYTVNNGRASYIEFDISADGGHSYTVNFESTVSTAQVGFQFHNAVGMELALAGEAMGAGNYFDPGWQENGATVTPPEAVNDSPIAGLRLTFRMDTANTPVADGFIQSVTITRTAL